MSVIDELASRAAKKLDRDYDVPEAKALSPALIALLASLFQLLSKFVVDCASTPAEVVQVARRPGVGGLLKIARAVEQKTGRRFGQYQRELRAAIRDVAAEVTLKDAQRLYDEN